MKSQTINSDGNRSLKIALVVIATAQLMFVLDDTIANIALPTIQKEMSVPALTLPWIINAYILAFGGLLLFGGRVGDLYGRRNIFRAGLIVFCIASLLGGLATNIEVLIAARGLQGIGAALAAPNALALIATTFPVGKPRNSAMAVYGAMSALGITIGVLLGGVLVALLSWRWVFFINIPIGLAVLIGTKNLIEGERNTGKLKLTGAATGVGATVALVYAIMRAGEDGWGDVITLACFAVALLLSVVFVLIQKRGRYPILPLKLFEDRNRSGSYVAMLFVGAGLMGTFYLLTLFLQQVLLFSPLETGVSSLPFSFGIVFGAGVGSKLVERLSPRAVAAPGLLIAAIGMYWLSRLHIDASFWAHILPAVFVTSFGLGLAAVTITLTAVHNVAEQETGVASAVVNMSQQVGAALGLAIFTTVATFVTNESHSASNNMITKNIANQALSNGYTSAFLLGALILVVSALLVLIMITTKHKQHTARPV